MASECHFILSEYLRSILINANGEVLIRTISPTNETELLGRS